MEQRARRNAVGATIRRLRTEKGFTQEVLSARCGVAGFEISRGTLAKIEAQIRGVSDLELFTLARVLGVGMEALYPANFAARLKRGDFASGG